MQGATKYKKRPCRVCRRWFQANPKLKDRQMTCGDPKCKREWHRKRCRQWNRNNRDYFRANYLQKKLATAQSEESSKSRTRESPKRVSKSGLPLQIVQEVIGLQHWVIIEYLAQLLIKRFQEVLSNKVLVCARKVRQLPRAT